MTTLLRFNKSWSDTSLTVSLLSQVYLHDKPGQLLQLNAIMWHRKSFYLIIVIIIMIIIIITNN